MTRTLLALVAMAALTSIACGDSPSAPAGTALLSMKLTDSPYSDAQAVLVTFSSVSVHRTGSAFTPFRLPTAPPAAPAT